MRLKAEWRARTSESLSTRRYPHQGGEPSAARGPSEVRPLLSASTYPLVCSSC
jgi:hypothetical protein